ncbi:MAG: 16S rRNA (guanine(527)-N(7))-methyltransferase RsmG [Flavobacterium sp.]|nr:MAG: 16S rRNA (guanine(527)-N(7))-methyltransferase RsmG [Flavobacterium sp.]
MDELLRYFPELTDRQVDQFEMLGALYAEWNSKINVISRKDIDELYLRHVLHSLAIAKVQPFLPGSSILDVGTGGGFPGIPLAILFPETEFRLVDVIQKKITVVRAVAESLALANVSAAQEPAQQVKGNFDFIVSRAVTRMPDFVQWVQNKTRKQSRHALQNGILYLKGGDLSEELRDFPRAKEFAVSEFFSDPFFETKKVVHVPL